MNKRISILYILLLLTTTVTFGFTFTATPTPETCAGNGTITFASTNADPNGTIVYIVYKLPDGTTPYATVNSNLLNGLTAGMYKIVAKETVGNTTTQQETQVEVTDNKSTLAYTIQSLQQACSNTTNISVNVTSGIAQSYEIFSGPILFLSQASPTFNGLTVGIYKIRVFDICGVGVVKTFTVNQNAAGITISTPTFANTVPPSCSFTVATNTITPTAGTVIGYPLVITYTIHPPGGGAPIVQVVNLASGNATSQNIVETIPDYVNQNYDYDLTIVDACNSTYTENFPVVIDITLGSTIIQLPCDQNYFSLQVANYTPPFTINFISFPASFNPSMYNSNYPGPYNQDTIVFGGQNNVALYGIYTATVVDACGRICCSPKFRH